MKYEDYERELNVDGHYKTEMDKNIDGKARIQHKRTTQHHYNQASVCGSTSDFSFIEQLLSGKTVKRDQADVTRWTPSNPAGERYEKDNVLDSENVSEILCKLLKLQVAPEVDMEPSDDNVRNYHISWSYSKKLLRVT